MDVILISNNCLEFQSRILHVIKSAPLYIRWGIVMNIYGTSLFFFKTEWINASSDFLLAQCVCLWILYLCWCWTCL
jgi:hypothetical protein